MHKSKLIKLFSGLSRTELLEFGRYLKAPVFNRDDNLVKLYEYIKKYYPDFKSEKLDKSYFLKKMTGSASTKDRKIHDWMSDLTRKLEDYLIIVETRNKPLTRDFVLLDAMKDRQIDELFFKNIRSIRSKLDNSPERDMFYYFNQWRLRHEAFFYSNTPQKYKEEKDIEKTMSEMDKFFCAVKLRYSADMMTVELSYSADHNIALLPEVLKEIRKPEYKKNKLFKIYELAIDLFYDEKDETYDKLEKLIYAHLHLGSQSEKHALLNFLLTHAGKKLIEGRERYRQKIFDWYVYKINNELILEDGCIPAPHFLNVMYLATALHEVKWLENFISNYIQYLNDDVRENTTLLAKAYLYFAKKEYKKSLRTLMQTRGGDFTYPLNVRTLSIQCYYELKDIELLTMECNNFSRYINRNENIGDNIKKTVKDFIRFVRLLVEAPYKKDITKEKLNEKLNKAKGVRSKSWLNEKVAELK